MRQVVSHKAPVAASDARDRLAANLARMEAVVVASGDASDRPGASPIERMVRRYLRGDANMGDALRDLMGGALAVTLKKRLDLLEGATAKPETEPCAIVREIVQPSATRPELVAMMLRPLHGGDVVQIDRDPCETELSARFAAM
jgi:hypothetical protein